MKNIPDETIIVINVAQAKRNNLQRVVLLKSIDNIILLLCGLKIFFTAWYVDNIRV